MVLAGNGAPAVSGRSAAGGPCDGAEAPDGHVEANEALVEQLLCSGRLTFHDALECSLAGETAGKIRDLTG